MLFESFSVQMIIKIYSLVVMCWYTCQFVQNSSLHLHTIVLLCLLCSLAYFPAWSHLHSLVHRYTHTHPWPLDPGRAIWADWAVLFDFFFIYSSSITQQKHDSRSTFPPPFPSSCLVWRQSAASDHVLAQSISRTGRTEAGSVGALNRSACWGPGLRHREMIGQERL